MLHISLRLEVVHLYCTPYHPQSNGQIERFNSTVDAKIASLSDWDEQLPFVTLNYNSSVHSTTRIVPFELMYARSAVLPCDPQYASSLSDHARRNASSVQRLAPSYSIIDLVLLRNLHRSHKLDVRDEGPYRIPQRLSSKTFVVEHVHQRSRVPQVTVDSLIPLLERRFL